jgi:hypothetical protein
MHWRSRLCLRGYEAMDDEDEQILQEQKARRGRNIAIALFLGGLVVLFFIMTVVRLQQPH